MCRNIVTFTSPYNITFNNLNWQLLTTSESRYYLYNAYYDSRSDTLLRSTPIVKILATVSDHHPEIPLYCQVWFDVLNIPVLILAEYEQLWSSSSMTNDPFFINCPLPKQVGETKPGAVSLVVLDPCKNATNSLRVINNSPKRGVKQGFVVCVKGMNYLYDDISVKLIEWIEMLGILGVEMIYFYILHVHENVERVLKYYEGLGRVTLVYFTFSGGKPNHPSLQTLYLAESQFGTFEHEIIPFNDCLYKTMNLYDFLVIIDIDEVIIPTRPEDLSWQDMIERIIPISRASTLKNRIRSNYIFHSYYFLTSHTIDQQIFDEKIPKFLQILPNVYRTRNSRHKDFHLRTFYNTEHVKNIRHALSNQCIAYECDVYEINVTDAKLHHYRDSCDIQVPNICDDVIKDTTILKYKGKLIERTVKTLTHLNLIKATKIVPVLPVE